MTTALRAALVRAISNSILNIAALHSGEEFGWWECCEWLVA